RYILGFDDRMRAGADVDVPSSVSFVCILYLLSRPAPRSTLFPYTTLFRSRSCENISFIRIGKRAARAHSKFGRLYRRISYISRRDRKSTRLNSSHVSISYAVFCLKKQNVSIHISGGTRIEASSVHSRYRKS